MAIGKHAAPQRGGSSAQRAGAPQQTVRMRRASSAAPTSRPATMGYQTASARLRGEGSRAPQGRSPRAALIAVAVILAVVCVVYGAGVWFFSGHFFPRTMLGGLDVSLQDAGTVAADLDERLSSYQLEVSGDGFAWTLTAADAGLDVDHSSFASSALADNNAWAWPIEVFLAHDETNEGAGSLDEDGLAQAVEAQVAAFNEGRTASTDASIAYNEASGSFAVVSEVQGDQLDAQAVLSAVTEALLNMDPTLELTEAELAKPARLSTDPELASAVTEANALLGTNLSLTMGGATVATVDSGVVAGWITLDENYQATVSQDAVTAWVSQLADQLDTVGTTRTYTRADGKQITVSGGTYGWTSDEAALVQSLVDAVSNKQTGELAVPTKQTAVTYTALGQSDWGAYVDIDLTEQHARYYDAQGNLLWESGIITGNPNNGNPTPEGIYKLNNKARDQTLIGATDPATGEPEYESPVSYWMPFVDNLIGLHDASWQRTANFSNPQAYLSVGSHGCVNLPSDKAAALYDIIQIGDCVIVHS